MPCGRLPMRKTQAFSQRHADEEDQQECGAVVSSASIRTGLRDM